eukprot:s223_g20.t1
MSIRITKIDCDKYSTKFTAQNHGLPRGARVRVTGIPEISESETLLTDDCKSNSFSLRRDVCVDVASIDDASCIVRTKQPHQISDPHAGVKLRGFDTVRNLKLEEGYSIESIIDSYSLRLHSYCHAQRKWIPAKLSCSLVDATLSRDHCKVMLSERGVRTVRGSASVIHQHYSEQTCMRKWQSTLRAAVSADKLSKEKKEPEEPATVTQLPDVFSLQVDSSGWEDCHGIFHRAESPLRFELGRGLISIVYVESLKSWCMLAEVAPLYPLEFEYLYLKQKDMEGPQLLYICRGSQGLHGLWEPVLGPAPGPDVKLHKEVAVRLNGDASTQSSLLLPGIGSIVLDFLFNYTFANWRGGFSFSGIWGLSSLEAILCAVHLWKSMQVCSSVCRTWRDTLQPCSDLTKMCYHAVQLPELPEDSLEAVNLPTVTELVRAIKFSATWWNAALMLPRSSFFRGKAWPAQISKVDLKTEMSEDEDHFLEGPSAAFLNQHAKAFLKAAKDMLQVPLAWNTRPECRGLATMGDGRRFASCHLLEEFSGDRGRKLCRVLAQADAEGYMELLALDGSSMKPDRRSLAPLLQGGLRLQSITRQWRSRNKKPRGPKDPCDFFLCKEASRCTECQEDVEGRSRLGASELFGGYRLDFTDGSRQISLEIEVKIIPFFVTSKDMSLLSELQSLLPLSDAIDPWCTSSEAEDEDEDEDDQGDSDDLGEHGEGDEEDAEDAEDSDADEDEDQDEPEGQEVNGTGRNEATGAGGNNGARRRLMGKQPPPREWC